ncbi:MAG: hypothetical protein ACRDJC_24515, partial [Thermomicrobiales bacterium]
NTQGHACADCKKDADCEALGFPTGSACLPWSDGQCADDCDEIGMVCAIPCGAEIPEPTLETGPSLLRRRATPNHSADGDE